MRCLFGCFGFFFPRVAIAVLWLSSDYLQRAYETILWPLLGFLFMPLTTLTYAWTQNDVSRPPVRIVLVVLAVLFDLGILGGSAREKRRKSKQD